MRILLFGITQLTVKGLKKLIQIGMPPVGVVITPAYSQDTETMKLICKEHNVPIFYFEDVNNPEFLATVKTELEPDLILSYTFPDKLGNALIASAKLAINMHPALLPSYKGYSPYFWTIANGETETGITYHLMTDVFDDGDIVMQEEIAILPKDTCGLVIAKQEILAANMLEILLNKIETDSLVPVAQNSGDFPKAPKTGMKDTFIHWDWTMEKIINRIRALNPYNGALAQYKHNLIAIYEAAATHYTSDADTGTVIGLSPEGPMIKCADGAIIIKICAVGKKYLLSGSDFIEYERIKMGDRLISW